MKKFGRSPFNQTVVTEDKPDFKKARAIAKEHIRARLTAYNLQEMDKKELNFFRKWIMAVATEMKTAKPKDYAKVYRATLFK